MGKFKVGKYYRTRDGKKVQCKFTDGVGLYYPIAMEHENGVVMRFTNRGKYSINIPEDSDDIIGEWADEPKKDYVDCNVFEENGLILFDHFGSERLITDAHHLSGFIGYLYECGEITNSPIKYGDGDGSDILFSWKTERREPVRPVAARFKNG